MSGARFVADDASAGRLDSRQFAAKFQSISRHLWLIAAGVIGDRTEADDVVQEAAIIAFRKLDEFQPGSNFSAWLAEIVRRCAANYTRKVNHRRTFAADPHILDQESLPPGRPMPVLDAVGEMLETQSEFDDEMLRALSLLSSDARCCLLLRVVEQLPYAAIGELLDMPEGTAMSHVHRSKALLRRHLIAPSHPSSRKAGGA
jgi:RNA polymerase sigma-70 factor (ECF subfamily)